ncbi:MAG: RNA polymerase sigma-70 factor [Prevotella sp.]|nr:RNA polymerase sigma-70 factor [Prevotella sp.]
MTDRTAILKSINQWDDHALRLIYKEHYKMLVGYAMQLLGSMEEAEDAVQDVMLKTWQQHNTFNSEGQLRVYLFNAVRNQCLTRLEHLQVTINHQDHYKREYREMMLEDNETIALHKEEVYRQLIMAIDKMPAKQRDIFLLAIEGKQNKEIAEILHLSINTVKSHKRRGVERLRETLSPEALLLLSLLLP